MTVKERFLAKVRKVPSGCWEWTARVDQKTKYGRFCYEGRERNAHRISYILFRGAIPEGLVVDHFVCDNRICVNPSHMKVSTHRDNILRGKSSPAINARKTECKRGHPFDEANTYLTPSGGRECRTCSRANHRRVDALRRATSPEYRKERANHCKTWRERVKK